MFARWPGFALETGNPFDGCRQSYGKCGKRGVGCQFFSVVTGGDQQCRWTAQNLHLKALVGMVVMLAIFIPLSIQKFVAI